MSAFPQKQFNGQLYQFAHLVDLQHVAKLNAAGTVTVPMTIRFGCHCFTEDFKAGVHTDHHRYTYKGELRAFDVERYTCSLQLPAVILQMINGGTIYRADNSYTYVAHITVASAAGPQDYSVFFSLQKVGGTAPSLSMFVKSAYLKPLVAKPGAQSWRFGSLAGQVSGAFAPKQKKPKPKKKKTP